MKTMAWVILSYFAFQLPPVTTFPAESPRRAIDPETLNLTFGLYQSDKATVMFKKFTPVIEALAEKIGAAAGRKTKIELTIYKTYDEAIDALTQGKVDFVRFGPASYITAKQRNKDVRLIVMEEEKGAKRFKGLVVVAAKSSIQKIADLRGKKFAFGDPNSTIGRYLVQAVLVDNGIHAKDLSHFEYLDRHDKVAKVVEIGDFDAGSIKTETFKALPEGTLRVIAEFDNVTKPWVMRSGMDDRTFKAMQEGLLKFTDKDALKELGVSGFALATDEDYDLVKKGMAKAEEFEKK